jgi:protease I
MNDLKGKRVAILVTDGFEQIELTSPRETLDKAGAKTVLVSPKNGEVQGFRHYDKADKFKVDLPLAKADAVDFDAVLLPGGVINGDALRIEGRAQQFVQEMDHEGNRSLWYATAAGCFSPPVC